MSDDRHEEDTIKMKKIVTKIMTAAVATLAAHLAYATGGYSCRIATKMSLSELVVSWHMAYPAGRRQERG
jgi:hypothetical protein